jgi:hypothetical protein
LTPRNRANCHRQNSDGLTLSPAQREKIVDLRGNIIEWQKARVDLFKWKLILVAGLGAAASGIVGTQKVTRPGYVLALIPLVCLYVDLLCVDQTLRVVVTSRYLQLLFPEKRQEDNAEYEAFVSQATAMEKVAVREIIAGITDEWRSRSAYGFFAWAQYISTICFAIGVLLWAPTLKLNCRETTLLWLSSLFSLLVLAWMYGAYKSRFLAVRKLTELGQVKLPRQ